MIFGKNFEVSGIMYNIPGNSHLQTNIVVSEVDGENAKMLHNNFGVWLPKNFYVTLNAGADIEAMCNKLTEFVYEKAPFYKGMDYKLSLQRVKGIYFDTDVFSYDYSIKGKKSVTATFILVAAIILLLSCINFVNLFVSGSLRAKTVGLKQILGAGKSLLRIGFYRETAFYTVVSIAVGLLAAYFVIPYFNQFTGSRLNINFASPVLYIFLTVLFIIMVLVSAGLPAFSIAGVSPVEVIKGSFRGKKASFIQRTLVVTQFTASISLLIITLLINKQVDFMLSQNIGFDRENIIYTYNMGKVGENFETVRNEFIKDPLITDVTMKNCLPNLWMSGTTAKKEGDTQSQLYEYLYIKSNYFEVMGMQIVAGENPFKNTENNNYCVINETAAKALGLEDPVDKTIILMDNMPSVIKGVVRDSYVRSMHKAPDPQIYVNMQWYSLNPLLVKINGDPAKAVAAAQKKWSELFPDTPSDFRFLDEEYNKFYTAEKNLRNILSYTMVIGFTLSVIGLFAMAYYATQRRIKEIAIRKVNGAAIRELLQLLNGNYLKWVAISFIISCPLAVIFMKNYWLKSFVLQAPLSASIFILVGLTAAAVAILTVSWQTYKAATVNPVESLKNE